MHYSIFATKDAWISSGSNRRTGESFRDQNFGKDEILELRKRWWNKGFDYPTRLLISFAGDDFTSISQSFSEDDIEATHNDYQPRFFLKLFEGEGNSELSEEYKLIAHPLSQSWTEGIGKSGDDPKVTNGVSWDNRKYDQGSSAVTWSNADGTPSNGPNYIVGDVSGSGINWASQSFNLQSPDIEMDVTDICKGWMSGSNKNYGFMIMFSGSQETDETTSGQLKFFSRNTHTIYSPKLEVRWDDSNHLSPGTMTLNKLDHTGSVDNYVYPIGLRDKYKESEKVRFRFGARKRYIQKSFTTSVQAVSGSYINGGSGSYSIKDLATGDTIIPFSSATTMSYDNTSNYFEQWMNTFEPNRAYKILIKIKYDDGQEVIHDNDFEFKVVS